MPPSPDSKGVTGSRLPVPTQKGSRLQSRMKRGHTSTVPTQKGSRGHASQSRPKRGHGVTPPSPESRLKRGHGVKGSRLPVPTQKGSRGHASQSPPFRFKGVTGSRLPRFTFHPLRPPGFHFTSAASAPRFTHTPVQFYGPWIRPFHTARFTQFRRPSSLNPRPCLEPPGGGRRYEHLR